MSQKKYRLLFLHAVHNLLCVQSCWDLALVEAGWSSFRALFRLALSIAVREILVLVAKQIRIIINQDPGKYWPGRLGVYQWSRISVVLVEEPHSNVSAELMLVLLMQGNWTRANGFPVCKCIHQRENLMHKTKVQSGTSEEVIVNASEQERPQVARLVSLGISVVLISLFAVVLTSFKQLDWNSVAGVSWFLM